MGVIEAADGHKEACRRLGSTTPEANPRSSNYDRLEVHRLEVQLAACRHAEQYGKSEAHHQLSDKVEHSEKAASLYAERGILTSQQYPSASQFTP